jgi:hypothetical protein
MDLARVYELRDLMDHSSSPDAYFQNFEPSLFPQHAKRVKADSGKWAKTILASGIKAE